MWIRQKREAAKDVAQALGFALFCEIVAQEVLNTARNIYAEKLPPVELPFQYDGLPSPLFPKTASVLEKLAKRRSLK